MDRLAALAISGLAFRPVGPIRPEFFRSSMEARYTARGPRITVPALLLFGLAGMVAILSYKGGPIDFFA